MRVTLTNNGAGIGYLDFEIVNWNERLGQLVAIVTNPPQLGALISQKVMTNAYSVVLTGGDCPPDLSWYWDGVVATLQAIKQEVAGFDYIIPTGEDPLQEEQPAEMQKRIH